ncbi:MULTISPECIES: universal stress protein [Pyrobaculum]|uniref:UspA domain protein n=3 Tax=Pyrobaculum TaxID=2276 RepID=A4WKX9_PYRAR|nr:universal stress protein [Pyrobaculum arsenaticum]ABP51046.1 UspA domain protein [Pyrobaculum arsenaticum DSM 13514]MCY0891719.1 universal stress protein [Pyrobaculum arsenaticum]NYR15229.1 universal stress protein [Pyrobaculum arsenaticum]
MEKIVVGYDGSPQAKRALEKAKSISEKFGSKIYVVHVIDTAVLSLSDMFASPTVLVSLREKAEQLIQEALSIAGPGAEGKILEGDPAHEIVKFAKDVGASLIVVGARGLSTIRRILMGSVSSRVVQESPVDVLIVKS